MFKTMRIKTQNRRLRILFAISACGAGIVPMLASLGSSAQRRNDISAIAIAKHPVQNMVLLPSQAGWILQSDLNRQFLFRSSDAGSRWSKITMESPLQEIFFLDSQHGWATKLEDNYSSL